MSTEDIVIEAEAKFQDRLLVAREQEEIAQWFAYEHLPVHLQTVSKMFAHVAVDIVHQLPKCAERTVALRKLMEAKDCAVRASMYKPKGSSKKIVGYRIAGQMDCIQDPVEEDVASNTYADGDGWQWVYLDTIKPPLQVWRSCLSEDERRLRRSQGFRVERICKEEI